VGCRDDGGQARRSLSPTRARLSLPLRAFCLSPSYTSLLTSHINMKSFALAFTVLPLLATALPWNDGKMPKEDKKPKYDAVLKSGPFDFTSTYTAYATPDQV
jgi:hypothetical protein